MDSGIDAIKQFIELLDRDAEMQEFVKSANTPKKIVELAESVGVDISVKQLRFWSRELKAPYFPWAEKGSQWRREFFARVDD